MRALAAGRLVKRHLGLLLVCSPSADSVFCFKSNALVGLGVQCVIAKSFAFIYGRNQPTLGLLGITVQDESFYGSATDNTEITINVYGREITIGERKWKFELDNLEIKMLQNKGLAEAYKKFGKNVFNSLCGDGHTEGSSGMEAESIDSSLEW